MGVAGALFVSSSVAFGALSASEAEQVRHSVARGQNVAQVRSLVARPDRRQLVADFLAFVSSDEGRKVTRENGYLPLESP